MVVSIAIATRSIRITAEAAARHCLVYVSTFLRAGGRLDLHRAEYNGTELGLSPDAWTSLIAFEELLAHGADVHETDEGFDISLPSGRVFELQSKHLLPSALVVLHQRFVAEEYAALDVAGAVVIDVGANIGDSAVYFADRGATHVYAFEPFSEPYAAAARAVTRNRLEYKVTVAPQGIGARDGHGIGFYNPIRSDVTLASLRNGTHQPPAGSSPTRAEKFELVSLASIVDGSVKHYPERPLVLKFDCEGCEFEALLGDAAREPLMVVKSILVEVHQNDRHSASSLWRHLEECGFSVRELHPRSRRGLSLLLATRKDAQAELRGPT